MFLLFTAWEGDRVLVLARWLPVEQNRCRCFFPVPKRVLTPVIYWPSRRHFSKDESFPLVDLPKEHPLHNTSSAASPCSFYPSEANGLFVFMLWLLVLKANFLFLRPRTRWKRFILVLLEEQFGLKQDKISSWRLERGLILKEGLLCHLATIGAFSRCLDHYKQPSWNIVYGWFC